MDNAFVARLRTLDAERAENLRKEDGSEPLLPIAELFELIDQETERAFKVLRDNAVDSRMKYNGIEPATIEYNGDHAFPAWLLRANSTKGVRTHVYLTANGDLRSYPKQVNARKPSSVPAFLRPLSKYQERHVSIPFRDYTKAMEEDQSQHCLLQIELTEILRLLTDIVDSIAEYKLSQANLADDARLVQNRATAHGNAMPRVDQGRAARRLRQQAGGTP
jgi:hypothetical protein